MAIVMFDGKYGPDIDDARHYAHSNQTTWVKQVVFNESAPCLAKLRAPCIRRPCPRHSPRMCRRTSGYFTVAHIPLASAPSNLTRRKPSSKAVQQSESVAMGFETLDACDAQRLRVLRWLRRHSENASATRPSGARHPLKCMEAQHPCPEDSASGCCETGMPDPLRGNGTVHYEEVFTKFRNLAENSSSPYLALSLATSDAPCGIARSVRGAIELTSRSLILLHVGCNSSTTLSQRLYFSTVASRRVIVNPMCVPTRRAFGSILHSHLLNIGLLARIVARGLLPAPSHFVLASSDMMWQRSGVEDFVQKQASSVYHARSVPLAAPPVRRGVEQTRRFARAAEARLRAQVFDADLHSLVSSSPILELMNHLHGTRPNKDATILSSKHEGSFYPWELVRDFYLLLESRGPLGRLNLRTCMCPLQPCIEETYLPTFAARLLPFADNEILPVNSSRDSYAGTITARYTAKDEVVAARFAIKHMHAIHTYGACAVKRGELRALARADPHQLRSSFTSKREGLEPRRRDTNKTNRVLKRLLRSTHLVTPHRRQKSGWPLTADSGKNAGSKWNPVVDSSLQGTCDTTSIGGSCTRDDKGAWGLLRRDPQQMLRSCLQRCRRCENCNYVSVSVQEEDCSWFRDCGSWEPEALRATALRLSSAGVPRWVLASFQTYRVVKDGKSPDSTGQTEPQNDRCKGHRSCSAADLPIAPRSNDHHHPTPTSLRQAEAMQADRAESESEIDVVAL